MVEQKFKYFRVFKKGVYLCNCIVFNIYLVLISVSCSSMLVVLEAMRIICYNPPPPISNGTLHLS